MTRRWMLMAMAALPLAAETKKNIQFTDSMNQQYGVQHESGPGNYSFSAGDTIPVIVTNTARLTQVLKMRNLPNGEHLLLRHIKDDVFELQHGPTRQKAPLRLALQK